MSEEALKVTTPAEATLQQSQASPDTVSDEPSKESVVTPEEEAKEVTKQEETTSEDTTGDSPELDTEIWGDWQSESLHSALRLVQNGGMSLDEAKSILYDPLVNGADVSSIEKERLAEKIGADKANLVMIGIKDYVREQKAATDYAKELTVKVAGSADNWTKISAWANTHLDKAELAEYAQLVNSGGKKAEFAIRSITESYNTHPGNTSLGAVTLKGDAPASKSTLPPMTRVEFAEAMLAAGHDKQKQLAVRQERLQRQQN